MDEFIQSLPKIELHAHLNGSLSHQTLMKLVDLRRKSFPEYEKPVNLDLTGFRSLQECYDVFKIAHDLVDCTEAVKIATENVIREFCEDKVVYLELRSTPRETPQMTKRECLQTIIDTIISCKLSYPSIIVKFLPSINISYGPDEANANFEIFSELHKNYPDIVRGIDLGGDSEKGKFQDVRHIFQKAREEGFRIALHCAEVKDDSETLQRLDFMTSADRIGHGTFIDESDGAWKVFREKKIPVEICLTSNVLCKTVPSYDDHHFSRLFEIDHPIFICTDDKGVFDTSLSKELSICADTFKLGESDIVRLTMSANSHSFASESEREAVAKKIQIFCETRGIEKALL